ncbi:alpha-ketoglutarate-dependent dioxygenase AlkB [Methylicorpusculum oleiharenae]|nr:alpha-ketoglutarate-dependent dioxygenase AlkB [Methylicorpusculum oleiharenae]MCD2450665.1 alpha-ketoglutarate-dependent dioxygenase AlkB [Methylicorpusculum oleiharenae]
MFCTSDNLAPKDGELFHLKGFYPKPEADHLFETLINNLAWQEEAIWLFGRWVKVPRLMCWYGDPQARYTYSKVEHIPLAWTPDLIGIRQRLEKTCGHSFNSVLANLYRDGKDSMGCHADNEKELGPNPVIASVSFGDHRIFRLSHNTTKYRIDLDLEHGDLVVMAGRLQNHWRHSVPKTKQIKTQRINLTFRQVLTVENRAEKEQEREA